MCSSDLGELAAQFDLGPDGDIDLLVAQTRFRIQEIPDWAVGARVAVAPRLHDFSDIVRGGSEDAPDPLASPAWSAHEERAEGLLAALQERTAVVLLSETVEDACALGLDLLMEALPVESGAVIAKDRRTDELCFVAARGPRANGLRGARIPPGLGIAGMVARTGASLVVREVRTDPRHFRAVDQATGYVTRSLLAVPLRGTGAPFGCVELLNPFAGDGFAEWHRTAAQLVAARIAARARL